ncbi:hypothetical protein BLNAU_6775 [Blattamonas nauphoetae]|uniref:Protein kinase domain-containing protein n=1 Tax=Blattamonas nauphoetae TaxID=2049346 RepID=A0ABQ9Y3G8_9EUKA|nr:hypothetical protein BLNAU_6775 [Blattamonas nauphoetae]
MGRSRISPNSNGHYQGEQSKMRRLLLLLVCFIPVAFPTDPQGAADESKVKPIPLLSVISKWRTNSKDSGNEHVELKSGVFHGHNVMIESESVLLSGKNSMILLDENGDGSGTNMGWKETLFCLRNGTLGIEKIDIKVNSAVQPKELLGRSKDKGSEGPYLVVVRSSTFWMVSCRVEMNDVNSPILVSSESDMVDSSDDTSVCLSKVELHTRSQHHGSFCAIEAGTGQSESVFIHVESSRFLDTDVCGRDGISFSLLPTCQERRIYPTISSSLSSMSFRNVSSSQASCPQQNGMMSQKMVNTEVEWTDHHLSGSTIRDMNSGGSLLCVNSSFASCHTVPRDNQYDKYLLDYTSSDSSLNFPLSTAGVSISFEKCTFTDMTKTITNTASAEGGGAVFVENNLYDGSYFVTITSCSFLRCHLYTDGDSKGGGAVSIRRNDQYGGTGTVKSSTFTQCESHGGSVDSGALHFRCQQTARVESCVFTENKAVTDEHCIGGGVSFLHLDLAEVFNSSFVRNQAGGGGAMEINTVSRARMESVLLDGNTADQTGSYSKSNDIWISAEWLQDLSAWMTDVISTSKDQMFFFIINKPRELDTVQNVKASQATSSSDETMSGILSFVDCRSIGFATCHLTFSYEYKVSVAFASEYEEETIVIEDRRTTIEGTASGGTAPTIVPESTISSLFTIGDGSKQASLSLSTFTLSSSSSSLVSLIEVKNLGSLTLNGISLSTVVSGSCLVLGSGSSFTWTSSPFSDVTSTSNGSHILAGSADGTIVNSSSLILHERPALPTSGLFTEEEKRKFHLFGGVSGSMLYFWYPHTPTELTTHINEKGEDHSNCGKYELPCLTISTGLLKRNSKCEFVIESALSVSEVVSVSETSILKGSGSSARELLISDGTSISVSGEVLTLSSLSFIAESSSTRTASLLSVGSGASLSVDSCSFSGFHSSSNGGVISAVLSVSSLLVVSSTAFSSCSSTQKGGGIHVTIAGGSFAFESGTSFTDCSASSGTDLFVSAPDLSSSITPLSMAFLTPPSSVSSLSPEVVKYVGNEDANPSYLIPLILYLMPFGSTGFVDENGADGEMCGFSVHRCSTIGKTQLALLANGTKTADVFSSGSIEVCGEVALAEKIEVGEYCLTISHPSTGMNGVVVGVGGEFSNAAPTSKLILSSLSISFASAISTSLFSISQGSVEIRNSKFVDVSNSASLFSLSGGSTLFESTTIGAISFSDTHSVFSLSGTSSLSIKSVDFESISTTGSGSVISSTSEGTISLDTVSFSSCNCGSSGKGRSISIVRPSFTATHFVMKSETIKVAGTTGLHEIYLSGSGLESLEMSGWESVIGGNDGTLTKAKLENVFGIDSADVGKSGPLGYFLYAHTSGPVFVSEEFWDHEKCGQVQLPCSSLVHSMDQLPLSSPTIKVKSGLTVNAKISVPTNGLSLSSSSDTVYTLTMGDGGWFSHTSGLFSISTLAFVAETSTPRANSLISISSESSLSIDTCSFSGFSVIGSGSIVSGTVSASSSLWITNTNFECCSSSENGGVVCVVCESGLPTASLVVKGTFDTDCKCGSGKFGEWVFLEGHGLDELVATSNWAGSVQGLSQPTDQNKLWGEDKSRLNRPFNWSTLLVYLVDLSTNEAAVSSDGLDVIGCGGCDDTHLVKEAPSEIVVRDPGELATRRECEWNHLKLSGASQSTPITVKNAGQFILSRNQLTFSSLSFNAPVSGLGHTFIVLSDEASLAVSSCSFAGFRSPSNGSVVGGVVGMGKSVVLNTVDFKDCVSEGSGNWIWLDIRGCGVETNIEMKRVVSSDTTAHETSDVVLLGRSLGKVVVVSKWEGSLSNIDEIAFWGEDVEHGLSSSLLVYLQSIERTVLIGGEQCADIPNCGHFGVGCPSIGKGYSRINTTTTHLLKISIGSSVTMDEILSFASNQNIALSGIGEQSLSIDPNSQIVISSGSVSVSSLSFVAKDATSRTVSVLSVTSGASLSVLSCSFSGFSLSDCPVVNHLGGSVTLGTVSFSTICRSGGNGSCLSSKLESGMSLLIDGIELSETCVKNGYGDGLFISFPSDASSFTKDEFVLKNVVEKGRTRNAEDDSTPHLVWIVGIDFSGWISLNDDRFDSVVSLESSPSDWIWTEDIDISIQLEAPLLFYLSPQEGPVGVDAAGYPIGKCGFGGVWCKTISDAMNRLSAANTDSIILQNELSISSELKIISTLSISGKTPSSHFSVDAGCWFSISGVDTVFSLSTLVFSLPSSLTRSELFSQTSGTLSLTSVSFGPLRSEDHRLCGHEKTPCSTISQNVVVSGVRSVSVKESCVVGGSLDVNGEGLDLHGLHEYRAVVRFDGSSQITQSVLPLPLMISFSSVDIDVSLSTLSEESWIVELWSGKVELKECSFVSSKRIEMGMLVVENGELSLKKMTLKNVGFSSRAIVVRNGTSSIDELIVTDSSLRSLIDVTNVSSLTMINSRFERISWTGASNEDGVGSLCHWSDGVFVLVNSSTTVQSCVFQDLSEGGLSVFGGRLDIHLSGFEETHDESPDFPSAHRNIHCEGSGQVTLHSLSGGDGTGNHSSLWIDSSDCLIMNGKTEVSSPLFVPTLNVSESVVSRTKTKMMSMTIRGLILMPCGLSLEVFSVDDKKIETGTPHKIDLESRATNWTETSFSLFLNESSDFISLNSKLELRARLVVGDSFQTQESILLKLSQFDERKSQMTKALKWLIPLIVGIIVAIIILSIIVCVLWHRRNKKNSKEKLSEMGETMTFDDEFKVDNVPLEMTDRAHHSSFDTPTTANLIRPTETKMFDAKRANDADEADRDAQYPQYLQNEEISLQKMNGEIGTVEHRVTLYSRLHQPSPTDRMLDRSSLQKKLVEAVVTLKKQFGETEHFVQLSPHIVFFDSAGVVTISSQQHPPSQSRMTNQQQSMTNEMMQKNSEGDRWRAPEVVNQQQNIKVEKAAVFSLGMMLWEIEKGEVPFRDLSNIDAQRQIGSGHVPSMDGIPQSLSKLIENCLSIDPKDRPTLDELDAKLKRVIDKPTEEIDVENGSHNARTLLL